MKIFMVAGEASGDIYGGLIAKHFSDQTLTLRGWGGENMQSSGVTISKHYRELAYMGLWEVISHLPTILKNIDTCWDEIQDFKPDALVLIDFPGFNMRIARKARKAGIKVYQVVAPQVWAWKKGRVKKDKKLRSRKKNKKKYKKKMQKMKVNKEKKKIKEEKNEERRKEKKRKMNKERRRERMEKRKKKKGRR